MSKAAAEMHEQIQALCKRLGEVEETVCSGYIYPKTLPADAVIVIQYASHITEAAGASIRKAMEGVWPDNKCVVLADGMSMEIVEGGNTTNSRPLPKEPELDRSPRYTLLGPFARWLMRGRNQSTGAHS